MDVIGQLNAALQDRYAVEHEIGAGGMATVFLARDIRHDRRVALKVLKPELGAILGVERFLAEIKVTANLQHPNLLPLFDSGEAGGQLFYVMPFIDGETLRARLDREKQLPIDSALQIATSIASALDYAHRHGVIHRDLKPENILLHEGQPLVADFGIALAVSNAGGGRITQTGLSLGTPAYMSPEQATGDRAIDGRTDIYSLGAMTYEMLSGEPPHIGSTSQAIIARVLTEKPRSIRVTRPNVPPPVEAAVEHALEKLAADRFATAREFADALTGKSAWATSYTAAQPASPKGSARPWWRTAFREPVTALLAVALLATATALAWNIRERARDGSEGETVRFELVLPEFAGEINMDGSAPFAISPDGSTIAYRAKVPNGAASLNVRRLNEASAREISGGGDAGYLAFSPNGHTLAYLSNGNLLRLDLSSGTPVRVGSIGTFAYGTAWIGNEIVTGSQVGTLHVSPAAGGDATPFAALDTAKHETGQVYPVALADGETILYVSVTGDGGPVTSRIGIASMKSRTTAILDIQGVAPLGIIDGLLVYHDSRGSLLGVPFDLGRRRVTGAPVPLVDSVTITQSGGARAALSHSGSLVYLAGTAIRAEAELIEVDLQGKERVVSPLRRPYRTPRYSPDGRRIAVSLVTDTISETWIYDTRSGTLSPLARGLHASQAEWSPDGKYLAFASYIDGKLQLWSQGADGSAPAPVLQAQSPFGQPVHGMWSPDGQYVVYRAGMDGDDLWYRALTGDTSSKPISADRSFTERHPDISPDGKWVAYSSNESGTYQIYVRPFPGPGARYPVTADGGDAPKWARDGRTLYYTNGYRMQAATVTTTPQFSATRRTLFVHKNTIEPWSRSYDLSPDGTHFLMLRPVGAPAAKQRPMVIYNWGAELREKFKRAAGGGAL